MQQYGKIEGYMNRGIKKCVIMTGNNIGDSGAIKISESLMKNTTLTTLDLGCVIEKGE